MILLLSFPVGGDSESGQVEDLLGILCGDISHFFGCCLVDGSQLFCHQWQEGRFVSFAAVWSGRQIGRIGFQDYPVERNGCFQYDR